MSLCGKPPDRNAFPLWDVWDLPWTTRGRSVWARRHCPCVGKICHVARSPCSLRPIQTMSLCPAPRKETRKPKPKQARTAPKTRQPREAKRGRKHKRKPQRRGQAGRPNPEKPPGHSRCALLTLRVFAQQKNQRAHTRPVVDVFGDLPDSNVDREHLADGGLRLARCRRLESTRRPRKTKKTKKRNRHTVRAQRRETVSPRVKTQPAAREHVGNDEAYTTYFRKKGEPQRRLAADPGQGDSLEDIRKRAARPQGRACLERAARWCRAVVEHSRTAPKPWCRSQTPDAAKGVVHKEPRRCNRCPYVPAQIRWSDARCETCHLTVSCAYVRKTQTDVFLSATSGRGGWDKNPKPEKKSAAKGDRSRVPS